MLLSSFRYFNYKLLANFGFLFPSNIINTPFSYYFSLFSDIYSSHIFTLYIISPKTGSKEIVSTFRYFSILTCVIKMAVGLELEGRGVGAGDYFNEGNETKLASFLRILVLIGFLGAGGGGCSVLCLLGVFFLQKYFLPTVQLHYDVEGKT